MRITGGNEPADSTPLESIQPFEHIHGPCIFLLRSEKGIGIADLPDDVPISLSLQQQNAQQQPPPLQLPTRPDPVVTVPPTLSPTGNPSSFPTTPSAMPTLPFQNSSALPSPSTPSQVPIRPGSAAPPPTSFPPNATENTNKRSRHAAGRDSAMSLGTPIPGTVTPPRPASAEPAPSHSFATRLRRRRLDSSGSAAGSQPQTPGAKDGPSQPLTTLPRRPPVRQSKVIGQVSLRDDDPFTLESFAHLISLHAERGRDLVVARVCTIDPRDKTRFNYFHYAAHHLNKVLFRTEPERGLLHRVRTKNPLSNDDIHGKVDYYLIKASIARAWLEAHNVYQARMSNRRVDEEGGKPLSNGRVVIIPAHAGESTTDVDGQSASSDSQKASKLSLLSPLRKSHLLPMLHSTPSETTVGSRWTTRTLLEIKHNRSVDVLRSGPCSPHIGSPNAAGRTIPLQPHQLSTTSTKNNHTGHAPSLSIAERGTSPASGGASVQDPGASTTAPSAPTASKHDGIEMSSATITHQNSEQASPPADDTVAAKRRAEQPAKPARSTLRRCLTTPESFRRDARRSVVSAHVRAAARRLRGPSRLAIELPIHAEQHLRNYDDSISASPVQMTALQPRSGPDWLVGRYIGNDYDFLYKAPVRQLFARNALEPDDALLFPLHSRPRALLPHHRWMRPLMPLLRFDSDPVGSVLENEFPRPFLNGDAETDSEQNPMAGMNWRQRFHYMTSTGLWHCIRHRRTRWFTVVYIGAAIALVLFFIPPAALVIVGVVLLFVFVAAFAWALASYC